MRLGAFGNRASGAEQRRSEDWWLSCGRLSGPWGCYYRICAGRLGYIHYRVPCIFIIEGGGRGGEGTGVFSFLALPIILSAHRFVRTGLCVPFCAFYSFGFPHLVVLFDRMRAVRAGGVVRVAYMIPRFYYYIILLLGQSIFPPSERDVVRFRVLSFGLYWVGLAWIGLGWVGLGCLGLGWISLDWQGRVRYGTVVMPRFYAGRIRFGRSLGR